MQYIRFAALTSSKMKFPIMRRMFLAGCALAWLLLPTGCKRSPSTNVAATVNNRVITYAELEKNYHSQFPSATDGSSEDQGDQRRSDQSCTDRGSLLPDRLPNAAGVACARKGVHRNGYREPNQGTIREPQRPIGISQRIRKQGDNQSHDRVNEERTDPDEYVPPLTGWPFMDHESGRIAQSKVTDLPDRSAGIVAEEFVSQFVHDDSWKRKPGNDESGDDHDLSILLKKSRRRESLPHFHGVRLSNGVVIKDSRSISFNRPLV